MLKISILESINKNLPLKRELMEVLNCSQFTIQNYIKSNSTKLTEYRALEAISRFLDIEIPELLEPIEANKS